jgi:hypothetical protein
MIEIMCINRTKSFLNQKGFILAVCFAFSIIYNGIPILFYHELNHSIFLSFLFFPPRLLYLFLNWSAGTPTSTMIVIWLVFVFIVFLLTFLFANIIIRLCKRIKKPKT